jgi:circadian clock protein KaiC
MVLKKTIKVKGYTRRLKADEIKAINEKKKKRKMCITTNDLSRTSTGVPGLDKMVQGGYLTGSINLVSGCPGTNKTIMGIQFIIEGIQKYNESGVYISFEEKKENVYKLMKIFGWDLAKYEAENKFRFVEYTPEQVDKVVKSGGGIISDVIKSVNAKKIVFDSITAITLLYETLTMKRKALLELFDLIRRWNCTAVLISETSEDLENHKSEVEEYEVDCAILIHSIIEKRKRKKYIEILKMRGTDHCKELYKMDIGKKGIIIKQ